MLAPELMGTVATLYGVGAAGAALLQARQVLRRGSSCEVSARFFATYAGGHAVWLLCGLVTLAITLSLRGSLLRPSSWGTCPPSTIDSASGDTAPASG